MDEATDITLGGRLRARGYRVTPQRQLVAEAVTTLGHASPDEILAEVRKTADGVNLSTIYRALDTLEEVGLVTHTHLGHGPPTYHAATDSDHLHLVCRTCGRVTEAEVDLAAHFVEQVSETYGFDTDVRHFAIYGQCRRCTHKHS